MNLIRATIDTSALNRPELVSFHHFSEDNPLPLIIKPVADLDLFDWASDNREALNTLLLKFGGILFRGFGDFNEAALERFIATTAGASLQYTERSSPRTQVKGNIYTSTEYPAKQNIFLHNENSYQHTWPMKLYLMCTAEAETQGETPIADCRRIYERLPKDLREKLFEKGFRIVRNYSAIMGLPWTQVFGTDNQAEVDAYCAERGIQTEWKSDGDLRTITVRTHPYMKHPYTGEMTWFNHGTFFHVTTLDENMSSVLIECMPEEDLPTNTYYGDGSPLSEATLATLRQAYEDETVLFPWQKGDILMIDNMLTAHGRRPFTGPRKVLVGMAEPMNRQDVLDMQN